MSAPQAHQTPKTTTNDVNRRSANFPPTIWGDYFLSYASIETNIEEEQHIQELKERVKRMIMAPIPSKPLKKLELIDAIQRLGVSRHFENEIDQVLLQIHNNSYHCYHQGSDDDEDLHAAALYFRLLRQQGYNISCDMFNKFKDVNDAKFKGSLTNDIVGLLSLYEATHLRVHGEDILEEALSFTTTHLESAAHRLSPGPLLQQVKHALYQPFWKGSPRLEARQYLSIYRENNSHNETLLTFAKLDFNLLQKVHQKELSEITRWWKELDFVNKLPFARDRVVESYLWALGCYYEPEYSFARMIFGKVTAIMVVIDDIYDVYGTFGELELFTEAVERWDISAMVHLPEQYMKVCYQALLDLYAEIEEKLGNEGNSYRIHYAREAMKIQVKSYFKEAKWFYDNYTPTMDEYLSEALNTSYFTLATTSFVGMGSVVTKDSLDWVFSDPQIVKAASLIGRLVDDMKSHKFEQKRGHVASSVECYMKEHEATEEQAIIELSKQVNNAWKDINETCHRPTIFPMQLILRIVNLARMIEVLYKHDDGFTHAGIFLKDVVVSLLVESVPL